jgi:hypothetical protein
MVSMGELLGFVGLLGFSVGFFAAFFRCERGRAVPCGTRSNVLPLPGTAVPGFHIPPLRGWSLAILELLGLNGGGRFGRWQLQAGGAEGEGFYFAVVALGG